MDGERGAGGEEVREMQWMSRLFVHNPPTHHPSTQLPSIHPLSILPFTNFHPLTFILQPPFNSQHHRRALLPILCTYTHTLHTSPYTILCRRDPLPTLCTTLIHYTPHHTPYFAGATPYLFLVVSSIAEVSLTLSRRLVIPLPAMVVEDEWVGDTMLDERYSSSRYEDMVIGRMGGKYGRGYGNRKDGREQWEGWEECNGKDGSL
jgi:hypothetical protein